MVDRQIEPSSCVLSHTPIFYLVGVLYPSAVLSEGQCPWGEQTPWLLPLPASRICLSWCFPVANFCNTCLHACPIIKCSGIWEQEPLWVLYHSITPGPRLPSNKFQNAQNSLLDRINDFLFCYCVHPVFRIPFFFDFPLIYKTFYNTIIQHHLVTRDS